MPISSASDAQIKLEGRLTSDKKRPDGSPVDLYGPKDKELGNEMSSCNHEGNMRDAV